MKLFGHLLHIVVLTIVYGFLCTPAAFGQDCVEDSIWCTREATLVFNNMHAGTFGAMFEPEDLTVFWLCGFQFEISGEVECSQEMPCRALLHLIREDDTVKELLSLELTETLSGGVVDILFDDRALIFAGSRYAVALETADNDWLLLQCRENCCPNARPVTIEDGTAHYNPNAPDSDDYVYLLWVDTDISGIPDDLIRFKQGTWGSIKSLYR